MSEDSRKYGVENTCTSGSTLSKAASNFARARAHMEKERGNLLKALGTQVIILLLLLTESRLFWCHDLTVSILLESFEDPARMKLLFASSIMTLVISSSNFVYVLVSC